MIKSLAKKVLKYPLKIVNNIYTYFYYKNSLKRDIIDRDSMIEIGDRVLVLSPHVDDETIGLGATLLKHKKAGSKMTLVYLTDGGGSTSNVTRDKLINDRKREGTKVKEIYGFENLYFLDELDGQLDSSKETLIKNIVDILEEEKPTVIYTPFLIDGHSDHVETTKCLIQALKIWNRNFKQIYMYEVNCPIIPQLVNEISVMDEYLYNKKGDVYKIFTSQWVMGFEAFRLLDRRKKFMAENIFGAEVFVKTDFKTLSCIEDILNKEGFKPEYFKQLSSEYNLLLAFRTNRSLKEEYSKKIDSILIEETANYKTL